MTERASATRGPGAAHDQRQRDIIEAVFAIVDGQGTEQVTIRNVAKAAGISPGRVQYYFPTKDALLSAAFTAVNDLGTENVRRRLAADADAGPEAVLAAVLTELVPADDASRRRMRIANAFEVYALNRPELAERLAEGYGGLAAFLASLLPAGEAEDTAKELIALASGLGWMVVVGAHTPEAARRTVTGRLRRLFAPLPRQPDSGGAT
jgi:AcrR family transcriptional regulator